MELPAEKCFFRIDLHLSPWGKFQIFCGLRFNQFRESVGLLSHMILLCLLTLSLLNFQGKLPNIDISSVFPLRFA